MPMIKKALQTTVPIGIFDSGVGGLSVLRAVRDELPFENVLYLADQGHVPYGPRSKEEIRTFAIGITRFLLNQGAKLIVVACNTASAAALHDLRKIFPTAPIVGMEPAVKPAAKITETGKVGILATPTTFKGDLYTSLVARFGQGIHIFECTCQGLVDQIESGHITSPETRTILEDALMPMLKAGVDTIVLGCTHYPFVIPLIREITGSEIRIIDPAPAVARQVRRLLNHHELLSLNHTKGNVTYYTSGDPDTLAALFPLLMGVSAHARQVLWGKDDTLEKKAH